MIKQKLIFDLDKELQKLITLGKYKDAFELGQKYNKKVNVLSKDNISSYILRKDGAWIKENKK